MNERIRELESKSGLEIYRLGKERYRWEHCVDKFAELIVRECAGVCESTPPFGPHIEMQEATLQDAALHIKKHFGIKE